MKGFGTLLELVSYYTPELEGVEYQCVYVNVKNKRRWMPVSTVVEVVVTDQSNTEIARGSMDVGLDIERRVVVTKLIDAGHTVEFFVALEFTPLGMSILSNAVGATTTLFTITIYATRLKLVQSTTKFSKSISATGLPRASPPSDSQPADRESPTRGIPLTPGQSRPSGPSFTQLR